MCIVQCITVFKNHRKVSFNITSEDFDGMFKNRKIKFSKVKHLNLSYISQNKSDNKDQMIMFEVESWFCATQQTLIISKGVQQVQRLE